MLHERLVELRKSNKLTQAQLAKELDITRSALSLYETGVRKPDYETLNKIADYFNVSIDWLLGRFENPHPEIEPYKKMYDLLNSFENLDKESKDELLEYAKKAVQYIREIKKFHEDEDTDKKNDNVD